eukprot:GHRR01020250.1.p1 GENE.GHRR01020250.1~~GHRR01020250.1.p1  ORF type:complete len:128 (+),score=5.13 GHRR01020250.1:587-970(+)
MYILHQKRYTRLLLQPFCLPSIGMIVVTSSLERGTCAGTGIHHHIITHGSGSMHRYVSYHWYQHYTMGHDQKHVQGLPPRSLPVPTSSSTWSGAFKYTLSTRPLPDVTASRSSVFSSGFLGSLDLSR